MEHVMTLEGLEPVLRAPGTARLVCSCGKYSTPWLVQTREGIGRMKLAAHSHIWFAQSRERAAQAQLRAEPVTEIQAEAARAVRHAETLMGPVRSFGRVKALRPVEARLGERMQCYAHKGECCPPECQACTGCRCSCECYICGLEDETAGTGEPR